MSNEEIKKQVHTLLLRNISSGYSPFFKTHFCYVKPSPGQYPFQYFWDTCFHIIMLCRLGEYELAKRNIESLFAMQEKNGFVGHMIFWQKVLPQRPSDVLQSRPTIQQIRPHMSALIQPPLIALSLQRIYQATSDKQFLLRMLPKVKKYYNWLAKNRDFDNTGLISIISPFESGIDWKPSYDVVVGFGPGRANLQLFLKMVWVDAQNFIHRYTLPSIYKANYFIVKDVAFNTIYAQDLFCLAKFCEILEDKEREHFTSLAEKAEQSIMRLMWNEQDAAFYDVYGHDNTQIPIRTPTIFFPILLPHTPDTITKVVIERHLLNKKEFKVPYPIPSVSLDEKAFNPYESAYIWRGPTWPVFNWFLYCCLKEKGYTKQARMLFDSMKALIEKSEFCEYYNPFTGQGYGAKEFTWSGLIVDMMD